MRRWKRWNTAVAVALAGSAQAQEPEPDPALAISAYELNVCILENVPKDVPGLAVVKDAKSGELEILGPSIVIEREMEWSATLDPT